MVVQVTTMANKPNVQTRFHPYKHDLKAYMWHAHEDVKAHNGGRCMRRDGGDMDLGKGRYLLLC